jgi:hypothetical protein
MGADQALVGAMGCASWRAHSQLREHAVLTPVARVIRGRTPLRVTNAGVVDLNEVGLTDTVLAAIWRFGPNAAAYAVSSQAEHNHLGADIAIVRWSTLRILLYQAKIAWHDGGAFRLKSPVTKAQLDLLKRRSVAIRGVRFQITSRLALYQQDLTEHLEGYPPAPMPGCWWRYWLSGPGPFPPGDGGEWEAAPEVGRDYYQTMLQHRGCSPSGVLAALIPGRNELVTSVAVADTWPWEFDAQQWLRHPGPYGSPQQPAADSGFGGAAPSFEEYFQEEYEGQTRAPLANVTSAATVASELVERLRLPASTRIYVIVVP